MIGERVERGADATSRAMDGTDYATLFGVEEGHTLTESRRHRSRRRDTLHVTRWLEERDAGARLVARYRTWINRSSSAPYRTQFGWERWSLEGRLLDREVRYGTRESRAALN